MSNENRTSGGSGNERPAPRRTVKPESVRRSGTGERPEPRRTTKQGSSSGSVRRNGTGERPEPRRTAKQGSTTSSVRRSGIGSTGERTESGRKLRQDGAGRPAGQPARRRPEASDEYNIRPVNRKRKKKKKSSWKTALKIFGGFLVLVLITAIVLVGTLYLTLLKIKNSSEAARNLLITTLMESGQLKFVAHMVCTDEEIEEIVSINSMQSMEVDQDTTLINVDKKSTATDAAPAKKDEYENEEFDANGVRIEEISGRSFFAKMMIIKDPGQVAVGSTYPWKEYGKELGTLVEDSGAIGGVNGGLYVSSGNKGGTPMGVVVQGGEITFNNPGGLTGLYVIGLNNDNILIVDEISGMSAGEFETYVSEKGIRDAVAFQDEASDSNNHFVPLIINGEPRQLGGQGSGANPRTAIGQRSDGALLLLVTDGRGSAGHLGATASDLISIMQEYGAVNAANLDGGSSSSMYYNGEYEMSSVTFYYKNSSWKLPDAFIVKQKGGN